jgi:hypothetical protein
MCKLMTRLCRPWFFVAAVPLALSQHGFAEEKQGQLPSERKPLAIAAEELTAREAAAVRKTVYGHFLNGVARKGPWAGTRIVLVPERLTEIHKTKPVATLKLLRDIVTGARPTDAIAAAAYAVALQDNPFNAMAFAYWKPDSVDNDTNPTPRRNKLIQEMNKLLSQTREKQRSRE